MRLRGWVPVVGWCAATLASIGVATVALQPVLRTATPGVAAPPVERPAAAPSVTTGAPPVTPPSPTPSRKPSATRAATTPAPAAATVDGWTVTTGADGQTTYTRSFRVGGGQALIRMTPGRVQLVTATPNPGYSVDTVQNEPGNLAVQFTEPNHYFIIHAVWHNGPFAEVSEVGS
ncbi:DNA mismatch repair protein MutL [Phytohabitans rumicis]|uniref:DNA mismatch repair protein MutL n=1 Tax=Phytohabitans rumicis TaxID=1076125 RepID=UPI0031F1049B